jgi:Ca2+/Na+ antiporter
VPQSPNGIRLSPDAKQFRESSLDIGKLIYALVLVGLSMYVIKWACDAFEGASDHLGKKVFKMGAGAKGATLDAIASSLPELFTTAFLLFLYHDHDGFAAGIATCAGSAVFNAAVIPAICIIAVTRKGVDGQVVEHVGIQQRVILRDGFFFLLAEVALIYFLGTTELAWWVGAALIGIYLIYFSVLSRSFGTADDQDEDEDDEDEDEPGFIGALLTFDYNQLLFKGADFSTGSAWTVFVLATATIGGACYFLAEAVITSADALGVPAYFTAVILGAAATSVPDTVISYKSAMKGDYDDAVANAVGSNIFDICVALGLPLLVYGLMYGNVDLAGSDGGASNVQELRVALIVITFVILGLFLFNKKEAIAEGSTLLIRQSRGWLLGSLYVVWTVFVVGRAMEWSWLSNLIGT